MNLRELLQQKAALVDQQAALLNRVKAEKRKKFSAAEDDEWAALEARIADLETRVDALEGSDDPEDPETTPEEEMAARSRKLADRQKAMDKPRNQPRRPVVAVGKNRAADRPWDEHGRGKNHAVGAFLQAVYAAEQPGTEPRNWDPRLKWKASATGMGISTPADGGFLLEPTIITELVSKGYEQSMLAPLCRKVPIGEMSNGLSVNVIDETSRATGSRWGGVQMYWRGEGDTVTATKPKLRRMDLPLESLMGLMYATREMLRDPVQLGAIFDQAFTEEIAWMLDNAIVDGTGVGSPLGMLRSDALISVAKETNQKANTIVTENIIKMVSRMWGRSMQNAVWLYNQNALPQLSTLSLSVGTGGVPVFLPANNISGQQFSTLFNRPLMAMEQCKTLGTLGDLMLVDPTQYVLIDQNDPEIAESIHVRFINAESTFRIMYDINGRPYWTSPITPANGTDTLSPYVALATRA